MRTQTRLQAVLFLIATCYAASPQQSVAQSTSETDCPSSIPPRVERSYLQGRYFVLETENFRVCGEEAQTAASELGHHAERLRDALQEKWFGKTSAQTWNPKCRIVLHSSRRSYIATVGRAGERTVGSSLVQIDRARIIGRRIDLLGASVEYLTAALPHELTHLILRDHFTSSVVPRWADEGMAILADADGKQQRHNDDLRDAIARRMTFDAAELLAMEDYPPAGRFGAFYGQSASLTKFLVARNGPDQFVAFLERACEDGYDSALREVYGIANTGQLDRQWRHDVSSVRPASFKLPAKSPTESKVSAIKAG